MRSFARPFLAALLAVAASVPALTWARRHRQGARAARQPASAQQAPAPQTRSARATGVREANRRGFTVLDTSNFQQLREGWVDRFARAQPTRASHEWFVFCRTRTGDVNLYGFGLGYDDTATIACSSTALRSKRSTANASCR